MDIQPAGTYIDKFVYLSPDGGLLGVVCWCLWEQDLFDSILIVVCLALEIHFDEEIEDILEQRFVNCEPLPLLLYKLQDCSPDSLFGLLKDPFCMNRYTSHGHTAKIPLWKRTIEITDIEFKCAVHTAYAFSRLMQQWVCCVYWHFSSANARKTCLIHLYEGESNVGIHPNSTLGQMSLMLALQVCECFLSSIAIIGS